MMRPLAVLAMSLSVAACDPNAKASNAGDPVAKGQLSREYESCASSLECQPGLRCADGECRAPRTAIVGDYHAAAGRLAMRHKKVKDAIKAYGEAINKYKAANMEPPLALYCEQGRALTAARKNAEFAELAARVLHRCAIGMPVGSKARRKALESLSILGDVGLDPDLLAQNEPGDMYLTKAPRRPAADSVKITATSDVRRSTESLQAWLTQIAAMRATLIPCWSSWAEASGQSNLTVSYKFKHRFVQGVYESQDGYKLSMSDGTPPGDAPGAAAYRCIKTALAPAAKAFKASSGRWSGTVTIKLGE